MAKKRAKSRSGSPKALNSGRKVSKVRRASRSTRRKVRKSARRVVKTRSSGRKMKLVLRNLILFAVLSAVSLVLQDASGNVLMNQLFFLLGTLFGFVALAFLIVLLVLVFLRVLKK